MAIQVTYRRTQRLSMRIVKNGNKKRQFYAACVIMCNEFLADSSENIYFCTVRTTEQIVELFKKKKR